MELRTVRATSAIAFEMAARAKPNGYTQFDVKDRAADLGADLAGGPPERLAEHSSAEIPEWREVVRAANIRL